MLRFIVLLLCACQAFAFDVVLEGLSRVDKVRVDSLIAGKDMTRVAVQNEVLKSLYRTGWFEKIDVTQSGDKLTLKFQEQPIITGFKITSQISVLSPDALKPNLEQEGIKQGLVLNPVKLNRWQVGVVSYLESMGYRSDIVVDYKYSGEGRAVYLDIKVVEKPPLKIKVMKILGGSVMSDGETMAVMSMYPTGWMSWYKKDDLYSEQKLDIAKAKLRQAYIAKGYFDVDITTEAVPLDNDDMSLKVTITPYQSFKISEVVFEGMPLVYQNEFLSQKGLTFDQDAIDKIKDRVQGVWQKTADNPVIMFDAIEPHNNTVKLLVRGFIKGSPKVKKVVYKGQMTDEMSLRRMSAIREGDKLTDEAIKKTKQNISGSSYVKKVSIDVEEIAGSDGVDVIITTDEDPRHSQISASLNWTSGGYGFSGVLGFDNKNWLDTGNQLAARMSVGETDKSFSLSLSEPASVYAPSTMLNLGVTKTNTRDLNMSSYKIDQGHVSYGYHWLVSAYHSLNAAAKLNVMDLTAFKDSPSIVREFADKFGHSIQEFSLSFGWRYNTLDRALNPTSGMSVILSGQVAVPIIEQFLQIYKTDFSFTHYYKIAEAKKQPIVLKSHLSASVGRGYGYYSGDLPFFERYHAGGFGSVRGHKDNSLGPRLGAQRLGGNKRLLAGVELILPSPNPDVFVPAVFVDMGNVFLREIKLRDLVGAYGVATDVWLPVGTVMMSYSRSFNNEHGVRPRNHFSMGIGQAF